MWGMQRVGPVGDASFGCCISSPAASLQVVEMALDFQEVDARFGLDLKTVMLNLRWILLLPCCLLPVFLFG